MRLTAPVGSGVPKRVPRALAAARADFVRSEMASPLMLGYGCKDVDRELVGERHVGRHKLHAGFHERRNEDQISGQTIQLSDHETSFVLSAGFHRPR